MLKVRAGWVCGVHVGRELIPTGHLLCIGRRAAH